MMWFAILLVCLSFVQQNDGDSMSSRLSNCGVSQGCWLMPIGCEQSSGPNCMGIVSWTVTPNGIQFSLITYVTDLLDTYIINKAIYGAVGFSLDSYMGDDTVFVCAINSTGQGAVYVNWNDQYSSERLYEASELMIANAKISLINDRMNCEFQWVFHGLGLLPPNEQSKVLNLSDPKLEVFMMFARGSADPYTYQINGHSLVDGLQFPFIAAEAVSFCPTGCGQPEGMEWITQMHQAQIPQITKQKIVITHSILMLIAFYVLLPVAIMSVRFGKKHLQRFFGLFIWLHVHWFSGLIAFLSIVIAFFVIYYQANFSLLKCSTKCNNTSFFRHLHALIGTFLFIFLCLQILISGAIPKVTSTRRMFWNFFHIFIGYGIWLIGSFSCFIGVNLPKTGLYLYYDHWPQQILAIGACINLICFIICEWIIHQERFISIDPDRVEKLYHESRAKNEEVEYEEPPSNIPAILVLFNAICGLVITATIGIMLTKSAKASGFKF